MPDTLVWDLISHSSKGVIARLTSYGLSQGNTPSPSGIKTCVRDTGIEAMRKGSLVVRTMNSALIWVAVISLEMH